MRHLNVSRIEALTGHFVANILREHSIDPFAALAVGLTVTIQIAEGPARPGALDLIIRTPAPTGATSPNIAQDVSDGVVIVYGEPFMFSKELIEGLSENSDFLLRRDGAGHVSFKGHLRASGVIVDESGEMEQSYLFETVGGNFVLARYMDHEPDFVSPRYIPTALDALIDDTPVQEVEVFHSLDEVMDWLESDKLGEFLIAQLQEVEHVD